MVSLPGDEPVDDPGQLHRPDRPHDHEERVGEADADPTPSAAGRSPLTRASWALLAAGALLIGVATWSLATAWTGLLGSHPIGWITTVVAALIGLGFVARALLGRPQAEAPGWRRWSVRIAATLATVVFTVVVVYTRPFSAQQVALDATADGAGVTISDGATALVMQPAAASGTGLVFYPGAKVDPRAYARILRPIAEAGYPVVITKPPYNLAILGVGAADRWIGDPDDRVDRWVVGGHSLGGAMASSYASEAHPELVGLLLYAAFPPGDLSDRELDVLSVSGTRDGLATPDEIADSAADLPPTAELVAVDGAIHGYFGDYGSQGGDGEATVGRETAQGEIVAATLAFLERVDTDR